MSLSTLALPALLIVVALAMMVLSGANDGGVLLSMGIRYSTVPAGWLVAILCVILAVGPLVISLAVARTLAAGLLGSAGQEQVFLIGTGLALIVVLILSRVGLPTSITLALIGGLAGATSSAGIRRVRWNAAARIAAAWALTLPASALVALAVAAGVRWLG